MWFFDWFQAYFESLRLYFQSISNSIAGVPGLGGYLSWPFAWIASFFANLSTASGYASSWSDGVVATANNLGNALGSLWSYVYGWLTSSVNTLITQVSTLTTEISQAGISSVNSLWSAVNAVSGAVYGWITSDINYLLDAVNGAGGFLVDVSKGLASSVWSWITSGYIQRFLQDAGYVLTSGIVSVVEGSLGYLVSQAAVVFADNVESFKGFLVWFIDTNINLVGTMAGYFADPLWQCADAVIGKLTEYRK